MLVIEACVVFFVVVIYGAETGTEPRVSRSENAKVVIMISDNPT